MFVSNIGKSLIKDGHGNKKIDTALDIKRRIQDL